MTVPEVQAVLDAIDNNWPGSEFDIADVPLERIDGDNADNLDKAGNVSGLSGPIHEHSDDFARGMNFVQARSTTRTDQPVGTEYDVQADVVVGVRLEGAHVSEHGAIDPHVGTADETSVSWNTRTWTSLKDDVREAIYTDRLNPSVGHADITYKDLFIENATDLSSNYSDYYRLDFDVRFSGFETLP